MFQMVKKITFQKKLIDNQPCECKMESLVVGYILIAKTSTFADTLLMHQHLTLYKNIRLAASHQLGVLTPA